MSNVRSVIAAVVLAGVATFPAIAQFKTVKPNAPGSPVKMSPGIDQNALTNVRRITIADAEKLVKSGKAVYIDVRSQAQYDLGHIKGALSMPHSQMLNRLKEVPPGVTMITYCACSAEQSSGRAVLELAAHGVKNAAALTGGWNVWKQKGLPTEAGGR
jgi:rhodanese-related sulfurtransferase